jgi:hypothetical protein
MQQELAQLKQQRDKLTNGGAQGSGDAAQADSTPAPADDTQQTPSALDALESDGSGDSLTEPWSVLTYDSQGTLTGALSILNAVSGKRRGIL